MRLAEELQGKQASEKSTVFLTRSQIQRERPESKKRARWPISMHLRFSKTITKTKQSKAKKYSAGEAAIREIHLNFSACYFFILNAHSAVTTTVYNLPFFFFFLASLLNVTNSACSVLGHEHGCQLPRSVRPLPLPLFTPHCAHIQTWQRAWSETGRRPAGAHGKRGQLWNAVIQCCECVCAWVMNSSRLRGESPRARLPTELRFN